MVTDMIMTETHAENCAARLLAEPVVSATAVTGGGNNHIFRIETKAGRYALKFYPNQALDARDRLGQEFSALEFLARHGVDQVPAPLAKDSVQGCALYEWIAGDAPGAARADDIRAMTALAEILAGLSRIDGASALKAASASCFSADDAVRQFESRLARLVEAADDPALQSFLNADLQPAMQKIEARARCLYSNAGIGFGTSLKPTQRTLSPSDFGLHNARRQDDGSIRFLDFEYFGWDDPVKMIADAFWHPGSALDGDLAEMLRHDMTGLFARRDGDIFRQRFDALFPIFGVLWCLIILNEFLPERWSRRVAAGNTETAAEACARQLQRARVLLQKVIESSHD